MTGAKHCFVAILVGVLHFNRLTETKRNIGPMGVGAVFISTLAISRLSEGGDNPTNQEERLAAMLHPLVSFVVFCSILTHGLSIPVYWFGRKAATRIFPLTILRPRMARTVDDNDFVRRDIESGPVSPSCESAREICISPGVVSQATIISNKAVRAGFLEEIGDVDGKRKARGAYTAESVGTDGSPSTSEGSTPLQVKDDNAELGWATLPFAIKRKTKGA